ncbi:DUF2442 domain-containing protein [Sediminispirochaeta smaragdinae]|uniref:DUF2442 domain-containing protein n=1 Tax=Sediminispirochaeta smaragdinae (strain DSM 11293 / JCM 15392 / SEBR 4228) TaxID=573413 RepID=E1R6Y4_SEDSS|nr:DUF2442 domain-containing protein [Sediminispirochaeta smaragdinae]ADK81311.1 Protein of unknown function DUF2442 [Sediminispirochaeta smaragdinae DSM 11293]
MYLGVKDVKPLQDYKLLLTFENDEVRYFDMYPYLDLGIFSELRDIAKFNALSVKFDTIEWPNGADLDPEVLYSESSVEALPFTYDQL